MEKENRPEKQAANSDTRDSDYSLRQQQSQLHATSSAIQPTVPLPVIEWCGVRVVTTDTLAKGYGVPEINIRNNLANNRDRFVENVHIFTLRSAALKAFRNQVNDIHSVNKHTTALTLWTERGAARMSKIIDSDQAWNFFENMEDSYFSRRHNGLPATPNFSDPAAAARAWADEYEAKQQITGYAQRQAKYITHLENLFTEGLTPVQFCRRLNGVNTSKVNAWLVIKNWLYDDTPNGHRATWRVLSYARDQYLTETSKTIRPNECTSFEAFTAVLLKKGAVWLYRRYLKGELPMKTDWNGEFTHDKELSELVKHSGAQSASGE
ncbi:ORF6N domain-containing protein [Raoultella sp. WB_B2P2-3]|uniref:ORF6N domain-containing protein n=1 Tax=Raoultella scottii TaxID=3040937 RepID=UPI002F921D44